MNAPVPGPIRTPATRPPRPNRHALHWPDANTPFGAVFYALIGGLIAWFLTDILHHIHIAISWH